MCCACAVLDWEGERPRSVLIEHEADAAVDDVRSEDCFSPSFFRRRLIYSREIVLAECYPACDMYAAWTFVREGFFSSSSSSVWESCVF